MASEHGWFYLNIGQEIFYCSGECLVKHDPELEKKVWQWHSAQSSNLSKLEMFLVSKLVVTQWLQRGK
jgi:hypothetical protein